MIVLLLLLIAAVVGLIIYCYYLKGQERKIKAIQYERNTAIATENKGLEIKNKYLSDEIKKNEERLNFLTQNCEQMQQNSQSMADLAYKQRLEVVKHQFASQVYELQADYEQQSATFAADIQKQKSQLEELEAKQRAYIEAKQREQQIAENKDYFTLPIDNVACDDIAILRDVQKRISKKETIDKVIYDAYFKQAYDTLMSHLFKNSSKICGIYKITDQTTGLAYIGQSVDIKERFKQHIKSSLAYSGATNKLYQTMQKSGQQNFTFEILEEVERSKLNEREAYWIEFYKTKEFGLNSTKGNGGS